MYVDGFVAAVPNANKDAYRKHAEDSASMFKKYGAEKLVECWGDDVPEGKLTSFPMAVQKQPNETVVFSWVIWPDKQTRETGWKRMSDDHKMNPTDMPFDGKRLIYGGFNVMLDV